MFSLTEYFSVTETKITRKKNTLHTVNLISFFDKSEISAVKSYINICTRMCYYQSMHDRDTSETIYSLFIFCWNAKKWYGKLQKKHTVFPHFETYLKHKLRSHILTYSVAFFLEL